MESGQVASIIGSASVGQLRVAVLRASFKLFVKHAWKYVCSAPLIWELPQEIVCRHLQYMYTLTGSNTLTISVPPGSSKSLLSSVLYPAWVWAKDPTHSFICATHTLALTQRFATKFRDLVESDWYSQCFPGVVLTQDTNAKLAMKTTAKGERIGVSVGGKITGNHANTHIIDDLVDADDCNSLNTIETANDWYNKTLSTRWADNNTTSSIVIAQRLHCDDIIGMLSKRPNTIQLSLPAVLESTPCKTPIWVDTRAVGELLAPQRLPLTTLQERKISLGSSNYAAQFQQTPVPLSGGMVKPEWLNHTYDILPKFHTLALVADCASTGVDDPTAVLVIGVQSSKLYLIDYICRCLDFPALIQLLNQLCTKHNPTEICIEAASSGHAAIQTFRQNFPSVIELKPGGASKNERCAAATPPMEAGSVLFPKQGQWLADFRNEVLSFPFAKHDEAVDVLSYAVNRYLIKRSTSMYEAMAALSKYSGA